MLQLGWNGIKFPGTAALADCFARGACGQLQTLDLRFNLLDAQAFKSLVDAIEKSALPELLDLLLQGNVIRDEGARLLSHAVFRGSARGLRTIDIRQNGIRNDGVRALWNVFTSQSLPRFCPKLQMLDMRRNEANSSVLHSFCPCPTYLQF
jgi:Ran GTPase-activating protein (RanGAP) involved in mRNA processing and transport